MNKKVIFLISQALDQRNYQRFGLENWKNAGWNVEVWDMTPLLFPEVWYYNLSNGIANVYDPIIILIKSKNEIPVIEKPDGISLFVDLINNSELLYLKVKSLFFEAGWSCLFLKLSSLPEPKWVFTTKLKTILFNRLGKLQNFKKYLITKRKNAEFEKFSDRTYVAVSGYRTYQNALSVTRHENIIKAHSFDYDQYISSESKSFRSGIGVFLDEDMPYHSDFIYNGTPSIVSPENYFPAIKNFFAVIEKKVGISFVIAAHPRSNYKGDRTWCYGSFPVEKNNTTFLIKQADLVVGHSSASIQIAVIHDKPIVLITTDEIERSKYYKYIEEFSKELGCQIINVNKVKDSDNITIQGVDHKKYLEYKYSHITMLEQHTERLWDIIIRELQMKLESNLFATMTSRKINCDFP